MKPVNKTVCSLAALAPLAMAQSANAGQRPNIIFFLVDDFGWTETSLPFGEETYPNNLRFHTPNMERLARTGVMMTNAYACPVSTPTRTSMMTGMNAAHMGITSYCSLYKDTCPDAIGGRPGTTNANEDDIFAHPEWNYNALCPASFRNEADSIAYGLNRTLYATPMVEILRDAGYHTIHVGKAHWAPTGTPGSNPYNMGFTVNIAGSGNGHPQSYLPEEHFGNLPKRGTYASVQNMSQYYGSGIHLTEALTLEALKTLEDPIRRKQPFYLYFAHSARRTVHPKIPRRGNGRTAGPLRLDGRGNGQKPGRRTRLPRSQRDRRRHDHPLHVGQRRSLLGTGQGRRAPHAKPAAARG